VLELSLYLINTDELAFAYPVLSQVLNTLLSSLDGLNYKVVKEATGSSDGAVKPLVDDS
jgi:hypothetical protein